MGLTVAILGRPNVGKSTLFNRLCGRRAALVDPTPGVTRDRRVGKARLGDLRFEVIDTAGLEEADAGTLESRMQAQTAQALADADVALLVVDARSGITPVDRHFADWVRRGRKPVILVANKCESGAAQSGLLDCYALGLGEPVAISAEHGTGMADLFAALAGFAPEPGGDADATEEDTAPKEEGADAEGPLQLAIIGRPNVGKSSLLNRLLGEERVITGPEPGVTRDAIAVEWRWRDRDIRLIDTAGMRRRARVQEKLEKLSVADTLRAIRFAHVVVLVLDGTSPAERQDLTIAGHVIDEGRAPLIVVNKWDLIDDRAGTLAALRDRLEQSMPQVRGIPIVTLSALTGEGIERLMPAVVAAYRLWNSRIGTGPLNRWLAQAVERHPPPLVQGRRLRLRYATQIKTRPPTFLVFSSRPGALPEEYRRYLVNGLREAFGLDGMPIRILLRKGDNPYVEREG